MRTLSLQVRLLTSTQILQALQAALEPSAKAVTVSINECLVISYVHTYNTPDQQS